MCVFSVHSTSESESSLDTINLTRTRMEQDKMSKKTKESPYDHLPSEKVDLISVPAYTTELERDLDRPCSVSPDMNLPNFPEDAREVTGEEADQGLYRSSPTVKTRSITPENAKKIRKMAEEGQHRRTLTTSRVSSDGRINEREQNVHNQRRVQTMKERPSKARPLLPKEETYQVPRPARSTSDDIDDHLATTSDTSLNRTRKSSTNGRDLYQVPRLVDFQQDRDIYKVPSNLQAPQSNGHAQDTYSVPRKSSSNSNYDSPRQLQSRSPPRFARSSSSNEDRNVNQESLNGVEEMPTKVGRMRPTRSFESLHRMRVNTSAVDSSSRINNRPPMGVYMDIELDKPIPPAKNAPLPPLPQLPGNVGAPPSKKPVSDSLYCEISDTKLEENRRLRKEAEIYPQRRTPLQKLRSNTHGDLSAAYPRYKPTESEGLAKALELSEEQGYELCRPAGDSRATLDRSSVEGGHARQSSQPIEGRGSKNFSHSSSASSILGSKKTQSVGDVEAVRAIMDVDPTLLGSSTPKNEVLTDEYIIVTGADMRPKVNLSNIKMPAQPTAPKLEDEYEVMTSARAENIVQRQLQRVQYPSQPPAVPYSTSSCEYSTPNPSLYSVLPSNVPATTSAVPSASPTLPKDHYSIIPLRTTEEQSAMAGINMDDMSPCEDQPVYGNVIRNSSSLSTSSSHSEGNEDTNGLESEAGNGQQHTAALPEGVAAVRNTDFVKTMAGSPLDTIDSNQLK